MSWLRRYGPLAAVAVALLLIIGVLAFTIADPDQLDGDWINTPRGEVWCTGPDLTECDWDHPRSAR